MGERPDRLHNKFHQQYPSLDHRADVMSLAHVAAGRYIGYVEAQMNTWNCLAGQVLIKEARGSSVVLRSFLTISGQWRWKLGITDPLE